jgi:carboxyl-terminal processing protease
MTKNTKQRMAMSLLSLALLACGGGAGGAGGAVGGSSNGGGADVGGSGLGGAVTTGSGSQNPTSEMLANQCASPRYGIDPSTGAAFADKSGSIDIEKDWVNAFLTETYLWYRELPVLAAANYPTPVDYFNALKTPAITASGKPKDQFHSTYPTADWIALSQSGQSVDYGISWKFVKSTAPRNVVVAMVEPSSPSPSLLVKRGMKLLTIDGIDVVNTQSTADIDAINAAIFPSTSGESHVFEFATLGGNVLRTTLTATEIASQPVTNVKTFTSGTSKVGYVQFNEHIATAQPALLSAFTWLKNQGINDLVLDVRYNGGGYLYMASQVAYMVAPQSYSSGKTFERLRFNDKNPFNATPANSTVGFINTTVNFGSNGGQAGLSLPNLGLSKVYVLTTNSTASASEAIINGLRGVDVQVNIIGSNTRGKPYGFYPEDNCGTTYFAIQFEGVNHKGFGDYADGFTPTCAAADDFTKPLGDVNEKTLAQALNHQRFGSCNAAYQAVPEKNTTITLSKAGLGLKEDTRISTLLKMRRDVSK